MSLNQCPVCEGIGKVLDRTEKTVIRCSVCNGFKTLNDTQMAQYRLARDLKKAPVRALHHPDPDTIPF